MVMGGIQSPAAPPYSKLMPETRDTASFFSFYDVTEKFAIVIGLFTFGGFIEGIQPQHQAVDPRLSFFHPGLLFLLITSVITKRQRVVNLYTINTGYFKLDYMPCSVLYPKRSKLN